MYYYIYILYYSIHISYYACITLHIYHTYIYIHTYIHIYMHIQYICIYILLTTGLFSIGPTPFLPSSATLAAKGHGHCVGNRWRKSIQEQHQQGT